MNKVLKNYSNYDIVDFLLDSSFIEWAIGESLHNQNFWASWPEEFPHKEEVYYQSLEIASSLKIESVEGLTHLELSDLITQINNKTINAEIITSGPHSFRLIYEIINSGIVIKGKGWNKHN
jgi:hypothetical protein